LDILRFVSLVTADTQSVLLDKEADISDNNGKTPLMIAKECENEECVLLLEDYFGNLK